jgi:hypothetical protein
VTGLVPAPNSHPWLGKLLLPHFLLKEKAGGEWERLAVEDSWPFFVFFFSLMEIVYSYATYFLGQFKAK